MNRRHFLGQVVFGAAAAAIQSPSSVAAQQGGAGLTVKFVGMMGYITRSDRSLMLAMPGNHGLGHYSHVPFLMARSGSGIANALEMTAMPAVAAGAFDMSLADTHSGAFVYRCLDGCDLEISSSNAVTAVDNRASQIAQMQAIAPGKQLRSNLRRWAQATVTVQGGSLHNSAAHPDAGKIWSFGNYKQAITDATLYRTDEATLRLIVGSRVLRYAADATTDEQLWVVSAAGPRTDPPNPKRLEHARILFEYFDDATAVVPTCEDAEGRITLASDLPCAPPTLASMRGGAAAVAPPFTEFCPGGGWCATCD